MADEMLKPTKDSENPASATEKDQAGFKKVDTEVQEEAATERAKSGGYD